MTIPSVCRSQILAQAGQRREERRGEAYKLFVVTGGRQHCGVGLGRSMKGDEILIRWLEQGLGLGLGLHPPDLGQCSEVAYITPRPGQAKPGLLPLASCLCPPPGWHKTAPTWPSSERSQGRERLAAGWLAGWRGMGQDRTDGVAQREEEAVLRLGS